MATPEILHSTISTTRSAARCTCMIPTHRLRSIFNMDHPNSPNEVLHNPYLQSDSIASPAYATSHSFPRLSPAPIRPQLRIITSLPPPILRPIPTRQPALIKSAPLRVPPSPDAPGPPLKAADREAAILSAGGKVTVQVFSPPLKPSPEVRVHRRRFSEKFKSLFSHLHVWRELPTKSEAVMMLHDAPDRPHRSPGTASFVVTRRSDFSMPRSAGSSSHFSIASRPTWAEIQKLVSTRSARSTGSSEKRMSSGHLGPPGVGVSHFSTPTTLPSGSSASAHQLMISKTANQEEMAVVEEGGIVRIAMAVGTRRCGSMPGLRALGSVWSHAHEFSPTTG